MLSCNFKISSSFKLYKDGQNNYKPFYHSRQAVTDLFCEAKSSADDLITDLMQDLKLNDINRHYRCSVIIAACLSRLL